MSARTRVNLLEAIERIAERAEESQLSNDFFDSVHKEMTYVSNVMNLHNCQVALLSVFINQCYDDRIELKEIAEYLGCRFVKLLKHLHYIDDLVKRRMLICSNQRKNGTATYRVPEEVVNALRRNVVYQYTVPSDLSVHEFFEELSKVFGRKRSNESSYEMMEDDVMELLKHNPKLEFVKKFKGLKLKGFDRILLLYICVLYVENDDESVDLCQLGRITESNYQFKMLSNRLQQGQHLLMQRGLLEYANENGMANRESFKLTGQAKRELLFEVQGDSSLNTVYSGVMDHRTLPEKQLFYNSQEAEQVRTLAELLEQDHFAGICARLKERGLRSGIACLLYGAPGTGKTETVYQLARLTQRDIIRVNIPEIKSCWVGESEKNIQKLFSRYRTMVNELERTPILLFNEADALINKRMEGAVRAVDKMENSVQNIILQEMESLEGILIATTNIVGNMDKAFERRFLYKIAFEKPGLEAKRAIWHSMIPELTEEEVDSLASAYDFSGGQIENICRKRSIDHILWGDKALGFDALKAHCDSELLNRKDEVRRIGFRV